jgi:cytochrome c-type biogenesis protein CcmF
MIPVLIAMAIGPMLPWKRGDLGGALQRLKFAFAVAVIVALGTAVLAYDGPWLAIPGMALGAWLVAGALVEAAERIRLFRTGLAESGRRLLRMPRSAWGMTLAHAGAGVVLLGIVASSSWQQEVLQVLKPGESVSVGGYEFTFVDARNVQGPNYTAVRGTFQVSQDGKPVDTLYPEARQYPNPPMETTEAAIRARLSGDLYAVIGDPTGDGGWSARLYHKPIIHWIWGGAMIMVLGGLISLSDRRHRVGAPSRRRAAAAAVPQAA